MSNGNKKVTSNSPELQNRSLTNKCSFVSYTAPLFPAIFYSNHWMVDFTVCQTLFGYTMLKSVLQLQFSILYSIKPIFRII